MTAHSIIALVSDAYGGFGGISRFNRDFFNALGENADTRIRIVPRIIPEPIAEKLPGNLVYDRAGARGKLSFLMRALSLGSRDENVDLVICGHINLLPVAWLLARLRRARLCLVIHGIEAWQPHTNPLVNLLVDRIDSFLAVSWYSAARFCAWSGVPEEHGRVLSNCVNLACFRPRVKNRALAERYGLGSAKVLMTLGRLESKERRKGFDKVIEALPDVIQRFGDVKYLIVGDGPDRARLETKVRELGLSNHVVLAGRIPEAEKSDHYNLADLYVMPSAGEGFGIVLIEAAACGVPVIGSAVDGSSEALLQGRLGTLVNPEDKGMLVRTITDALTHPAPRQRNPLIETFATERFRARANEWLAGELAASSAHSARRIEAMS